MNSQPERHPTGIPNEIEEEDLPFLDAVRSLYVATDPVPEDLPTRVRLALDMAWFERELATICADLEMSPAARGTQHARTITFECETLTIAITISPADGGYSRIDGWLAPARQLAVELWQPDLRRHTRSDHGGRFVFADVPSGETQLAVRPDPDGAEEPRPMVVTQPVVL